MSRVVILLNLAEGSRQRFRTFFETEFPDVLVAIVADRTELEPYLPEAEVIMSFGKPLGPQANQIIEKARKLKWIQSLGTGVDNIVDLPSLPRDVIVTNMHGIHGASMSEAAIFLMMALGRQFPRSVHNKDGKSWDRWPMQLLDRKTVGIFGMGAIATGLGPRCKALGMTVVGISSMPRAVAGFDRVEARSKLHQVAAEVDFLVVLVPYSPETHHVVDAALLGAMKKTAYLVNLARGGVTDEPALVAALQNKTIAGAALDVFEKEPLPQDHPLWSLDNVIITPHLGGYGDDYDDQALAIIGPNLRHFLAGNTGALINIVKR